ncbi:hypothetical protein [Kitasatospora sp. NPDC017646]|uniref:hypothetical protein n=1 Tax=Kitasatospora sp. NPDC017646 TaxID=3364024 RepID=UPI0037B3D2C9
MPMRFRPRATLAVTAGALALSFAGVPTASVAPGVGTTENDDRFTSVRDLEAGRCHRGLGADTATANRTIAPIPLPPGGNCTTKTLNPLSPGESRPDENAAGFPAPD